MAVYGFYDRAKHEREQSLGYYGSLSFLCFTKDGVLVECNLFSRNPDEFPDAEKYGVVDITDKRPIHAWYSREHREQMCKSYSGKQPTCSLVEVYDRKKGRAVRACTHFSRDPEEYAHTPGFEYRGEAWRISGFCL